MENEFSIRGLYIKDLSLKMKDGKTLVANPQVAANVNKISFEHWDQSFIVQNRQGRILWEFLTSDIYQNDTFNYLYNTELLGGLGIIPRHSLSKGQ